MIRSIPAFIVTVDAGQLTQAPLSSTVTVPVSESTVTMKAGIERIMKDRVPGVTQVVQPGEDLEYGTAVSL
jgi:hypothetical protein